MVMRMTVLIQHQKVGKVVYIYKADSALGVCLNSTAHLTKWNVTTLIRSIVLTDNHWVVAILNKKGLSQHVHVGMKPFS